MNASDARHLKRQLQSFVHGANLSFALLVMLRLAK